jgi:hypothetical protein
MPSFGEVAHVAQRGKDLRLPKSVTGASGELPDVSDDELPVNAWVVHETALDEAQKAGAPQHLHDGIPGVRYDISLNGVMFGIWKGMSRDPDDADAVEARRAIGTYLRQTANVVCLTRGNRTTLSTWWIRLVWNEAPPEPVRRKPRPGDGPGARPAVRVTAAEVAQPTAPVTVSYQCQWPGCALPFSSPGALSAHHFAAHKGITDYMLEALTSLGRPARVPQIVEAATAAGYPGSDEAARRALESLWDNRKVLRREIHHPNGTGWAYTLHGVPGTDEQWVSMGWVPPSAVPTEPSMTYPCREPGCTAPPFPGADVRRRHENTAHPDLSSREWACPLNDGERFYDRTPLTIHLGRAHRLPNDSREFKRFMDAAETMHADYIQARETGGAEAPAPPPSSVPAVHAHPKPAPVPAPLDAPQRATIPGVKDPRVAAVRDLLDEHEQLVAERDQLREENSKLRSRLALIAQAFGK